MEAALNRRPGTPASSSALRPIALCLVVLGAAAGSDAAQAVLGPRAELTHPGKGHEVHLSGPAVVSSAATGPLIAWIAAEGTAHHLYVVRAGNDMARPGGGAAPRVRVNPDGLTVESAHQSPGLAVGPGGEIYVSWSSMKPKPESALFASDLQVSRSLDGGRTFAPPLRINEDRPLSHSFEGMAVTSDGIVVVSWIDSRDGWDKAATYATRLVDRGTRVAEVVKLDGDTCVCCRVSAAAARADTIALAWRKVFAGDVRDMVIATSRDGGRSFSPPALVHADGWQITACPHRGGTVRLDGRGRAYMAWYTEGKNGDPTLLVSTAPGGRQFSAPLRLNATGGTVPDHLRMAVDEVGHVAVL